LLGIHQKKKSRAENGGTISHFNQSEGSQLMEIFWDGVMQFVVLAQLYHIYQQLLYIKKVIHLTSC